VSSYERIDKPGPSIARPRREAMNGHRKSFPCVSVGGHQTSKVGARDDALDVSAVEIELPTERNVWA